MKCDMDGERYFSAGKRTEACVVDSGSVAGASPSSFDFPTRQSTVPSFLACLFCRRTFLFLNLNVVVQAARGGGQCAWDRDVMKNSGGVSVATGVACSAAAWSCMRLWWVMVWCKPSFISEIDKGETLSNL